jgi:hypothetical protein
VADVRSSRIYYGFAVLLIVAAVAFVIVAMPTRWVCNTEPPSPTRASAEAACAATDLMPAGVVRTDHRWGPRLAAAFGAVFLALFGLRLGSSASERARGTASGSAPDRGLDVSSLSISATSRGVSHHGGGHMDERRDEDEPVEHASEPLGDVPADVPEADAVEQASPLVPDETRGTDRIDERPEADALDQDRVPDDSAEQERG